MLCPTLERAGIHRQGIDQFPCFWVGDFILFDIKEALQGRLLSFSQARPTSWHHRIDTRPEVSLLCVLATEKLPKFYVL
jgi:hypothetical protein